MKSVVWDWCVHSELSTSPFVCEKVVLGNKDHIGRLLQLILGVAINCSKQAEYIQQIMEMEEDVQRLIMLAIQELHGLPTQSIHSMPVIEDDAQVR